MISAAINKSGNVEISFSKLIESSNASFQSSFCTSTNTCDDEMIFNHFFFHGWNNIQLKRQQFFFKFSRKNLKILLINLPIIVLLLPIIPLSFCIKFISIFSLRYSKTLSLPSVNVTDKG